MSGRTAAKRCCPDASGQSASAPEFGVRRIDARTASSSTAAAMSRDCYRQAPGRRRGQRRQERGCRAERVIKRCPVCGISKP